MINKNLFFLDIETNSDDTEFNKDNQEIIQIWIYNPKTKEEFNQCINIWKPLSENIKRLTWIADEEISNWKDINTVLDGALKFIWDKNTSVIVWHNIEEFDLYLLWKANKNFFEYNFIDTLQLFLFLVPWLKSYKVQDIYANFLKEWYIEKHQALQDSKDEYELFSKIINKDFLGEYYKNAWKTLLFLKDIINKYSSNLSEKCLNFELIQELLSWIEINDYTKTKWKLLSKYFHKYENNWNDDEELPPINPLTTEEIAEWYDEFIKKAWKSKRPEQESMTQHVKDMFNWEFHDLFIQAWTGTWKTYWYLLPAINFVSKNKKHQIFIATYTKVLQEQLMEKDIPALKQLYPDINFEHLKASSEWLSLGNIPFKWSLWFRELALRNRIYRENYFITDIHFSLQLKIWKEKIQNFLYNSFGTKRLDYDYWFKWKTNEQLKTWNIFIINHAFMVNKFNPIKKDPITGLTITKELPSIIPTNKYFIIDEWHNLEWVIREFLTIDYTKINIDKILSFLNINSTFNIIKLIGLQIENYELNKEELWWTEIFDEIIKWLKAVKNVMNNILSSENRYKLNYLYKNFTSKFILSKFYKTAYNDIIDLRNKWYDTTASEYDRNTFNILYESEDFKKFMKYALKFSNEIIEKISKICKWINELKFIIDIINWIIRYFKIGNILLENDDKNYFFDSIVEISESNLSVYNFWFKAIPIYLSRWTEFLSDSMWNSIFSATLFDKWKESYVLKEVFWEKYNYAKIQKYNSPFKYKLQRKISVVETEDKKRKQDIMFEFIKKYQWRSLILTNTLAEKRRLASLCKQEFEKQWILILMHKSWTLDSKVNQRNVQCLRDNPNTILIGSKSYAEWVDVPWDNLKLVVLTKLPFLPPTPFILFQNKKWKNKWENFVYKFLCSINFRQSIWRLIRTVNDTWDILVLDERLLKPSWNFFTDYIKWENLIHIQ